METNGANSNRRFALGNQLDIEQILTEAQHRWLRPAEICEILLNYRNFRIAPEPANMPPNGSLFLFDRKVLRYFRKDGHNWRKKKDGKTVKEAHERLKAGSIDVLHCYYAHGEDNESFQRRSYWLLEEELSHIVLVHYRDVQSHRTNTNRTRENVESIPYSQENEDILSNSVDSSVSSAFHPNSYRGASQTPDSMSLNSIQAPDYEDTESVYNPQATSGFHSLLEPQQPAAEKIDPGSSLTYYTPNDYHGNYSAISAIGFSQGGKESVDLAFEPQKNIDFTLWEDVLGNSSAAAQSVSFQPTVSSSRPETSGNLPKQESEILNQLFTDGFGKRLELGSLSHSQGGWETSDGDASHFSKWPLDQKFHSDTVYPTSRFREEADGVANIADPFQPNHTYPYEQIDHSFHSDLRMPVPDSVPGYLLKSGVENNLATEGTTNHPSVLKHSLLNGSLMDEGLKKLDSFNRWMSKELGDVDEPIMHSPSSGSYWETVEGENEVDNSGVHSQAQLDSVMLGPSLSLDQLFSIVDFSPNWAYEDSEIKVLITGKFLKSPSDAKKFKWSIMFGEVEVPAELVADGVLRCYAPKHNVGRVPFYVTCSNRLACSEVREFEYRVNPVRNVDVIDTASTTESLQKRFVKLLSVGFDSPHGSASGSPSEKSSLSNKISALMKEDNDGWNQMLDLTLVEQFSPEKIKDQLIQRLLKERLQAWLLHKVEDGGKGPNVLDEDGQGVLHFAAALGYDWAIPPILLAGVNVNFRDVNGWTALHWAAYCGRERTVVALMSLGASAGALSDPTPKSQGLPAAELAASNGHKGIAAYLAESDLSSVLSSIDLKENKESAVDISGVKAVQAVAERTTPVMDTDVPDGLSLKHSLAAVCNATQAAARIHQVFRIQSFQRKQIKEYGDDNLGISEERALSRIALKTQKQGHDEPVQAAAIRIQNKYRSWKGRKEFLIIRQRIVKIQAHVRGHQVRNKYKKIIWSVGILDKIILRWRRKGSGLRGFKSEGLVEGPSTQAIPSKEDDFDFLKEGRKQTEARLQKALARVKSMAQNPEARDQYRRLLDTVSEIQETKVEYERVLNSSEEPAGFDDDLIDLQAWMEDDTDMFMS